MLEGDRKIFVGIRFIRIHLVCALRRKRTKAYYEIYETTRLCGPISAIAKNQPPPRHSLHHYNQEFSLTLFLDLINNCTFKILSKHSLKNPFCETVFLKIACVFSSFGPILLLAEWNNFPFREGLLVWWTWVLGSSWFGPWWRIAAVRGNPYFTDYRVFHPMQSQVGF